MNTNKDKWLDGKLVECEFGFCETCGGRRSAPNSKLCEGCWSIEAHLERYLRDGGAKAIYFVSGVLEAAKREEIRRKLIKEVESQRMSVGDVDDDEAEVTAEKIQAHNEAITDAIGIMRDLDLTS